jgi:intermembrane space import and assembly protein 40
VRRPGVVFGFSSNRTLFTGSKTASNAWKRAVYPAVLFATPAVAYLTYQYKFANVYADDELPKDESLGEVIESKDVETHATLLDIDSITEKKDAPETTEEEQQPAEADGALDSEVKGAYDPETGEINWDCPCLGGMANGPCGEEFKAAFSCFVYSEADPKGIDCIEKFKGMQDCFREYPEVYSEELREDSPVDAEQQNPEPPASEAPAQSTTSS